MFIIFMGVAGCGKTTLGKITAEALGVPFYEGDEFHPQENVEKMSQGIPLTDEDRSGWLETLAELIRTHLEQGDSGILTCSALKEKYRQRLRVDKDLVHFIFLKGSYEVIQDRMSGRTGHYMPVELLKSQFDALEEPEDAFVVDIEQSPEEAMEDILEYLQGIGFSGDTPLK